jgi:mannose-6-phosphate isomerase-like protein (cupin superfamily)
MPHQEVVMEGFTVSAEDGERLSFSDAEFIVKVSGASTGGALSVIEEVDPLDTPLHVHSNEDELWYVLEGEHIFQIGHVEMKAGPGDVVFGPRGVPHAQRRVVPRKGRFIEVFSPGGFDGFFRELAQAEASGASMPEVYRSVSEKYGITWL